MRKDGVRMMLLLFGEKKKLSLSLSLGV